jgi:hypothetical protein
MGARCPRLPDDAPRPDLFLFENDEVPGVPLNDVQEVSHYVAALNHGLDRLRGGFPLSLRLIREIHEVLLSKGRGSDKQPGEFRESQNWIGGTRPGTAVFVPPPPELILDCMSARRPVSVSRRPKFRQRKTYTMPSVLRSLLRTIWAS